MSMRSSQESALLHRPLENGRREAVERSCALLRREGFVVSRVVASRSRRTVGSPDLLAASGPRVMRVFVLLDGEVDAAETRGRIRAASRQGETRVYVRRPLSWRVLSNLARWGVPGVSVVGW